ncbi:Polycystin Cation Channel [Phytophthora megakarya]|uniref:Polycystin Cation Channel n=1 Tax=Phytophthora megakarya TaxID=4795 RepID=A0A225W3U9_9STRA|nr:Polycystin Cation Channel [Phytophthora megakarya]
MLFTHIPTSRMYEQSYAISSILAQSGGDAQTPNSPIKFYNINQLGDVFNWLNNAFVPSVFVTQDQNGVDLAPEDYARIGLFNKGLGGVLIEVYTKSQVDCSPNGSLFQLYPVCHAYEGITSEYSTYMLIFSLNATDALNALDGWKNENYIDIATGKVVISVLTYNGELEGYVVTELILDFHEGGFVTPKATARPTISIPYGSRTSYGPDILVWIWWVVALVWAISSIFKWRKKEKRPSRQGMITQSFGLFITEAAMCVFYAIWGSIASRLNNSNFQDSLWNLADPSAIDVGGTEDDIASLNVVIDNLKQIAHLTSALRVVGAVIIALIGLQILSRFRFHPQLNILTRTVTSALKQFAAFFVVFIVIFLTFTIIGSMIFGDRAKEFSNWDNSMASCINMLFGVFDFETIKDLQFSVAFYWIYMIVVSIVLMNMMLAIVLDAYADVSSESYKKATNVILANRIATICWDFVCDLRIAMCSRDIVVSHGKIRSRLLESALKKIVQESPYGTLTLETLKSLFPNAEISHEDLQATLLHIEQGIVLVDTLKSASSDPSDK